MNGFEKYYKYKDLFPKEFYTNIKFPETLLRSRANRPIKSQLLLTYDVFMQLLKYILDDCIKRNVKFIFFTSNKEYHLIKVTQKAPGDIKRILRRKGIYQDVDLIQTDGLIYQFIYYNSFRNRMSRIRVDKLTYKKVTDKSNTGMKWNGFLTSTITDFYPLLIKKFGIDKKILFTIIKQGFKQMGDGVIRRRGVFLCRCKFTFIIIDR